MGEAVSVDQPGLEAPPARPEPERDRYGRYLIPDPRTGEKRSWTRATTWAEAIDDHFALTKWELRIAALGLSQRPDLVASVAAVIDPEGTEGKRKLNKLVEAAKEQGGSSHRSNLGTALHSFAEAVDTGREIVHIPAPFDKDIEAYRKAMRAVRVSRNYVEKIGLVPSLEVAGTMDRVVAFPHAPLPLIGDLKTGSDLKYSWLKIAIQLALYAHAETVYDPVDQRHRRMLPVNQDNALVIHLPAGQARCTLFLVDIAAGWEMAQVCGTVRGYRVRRDLAQSIEEVAL